MKKKFFYVVVLSLVFMLLNLYNIVYAGYKPVGVSASVSYVKQPKKDNIIICVGDSRTMQYTFGGGKKIRSNFVFCFVNGGNGGVIDKKRGSLSKHLTKYIKKYKKYNPIIVFNFGVNGNGKPTKNAKRLIRIYNQWMKAYPNLKFYVQGVGPTNINGGSYANSNVIKLNKILKKEYEPKGIYIDSYKYIKDHNIVNSSGKGFRDKLHYNWATSEQLLKQIRRRVNEDLAV